MKNLSSLLLTLFICWISLLSALAEVTDDVDDSGKEKKQIFHVYDDINLISTLKIQYDIPRVVIKAVYPQLSSKSAMDNEDKENMNDINEDNEKIYSAGNDNEGVNQFNQIVLGLIQDEIKDFKLKTLLMKNAQKNIPHTSIKNDLYLDYATSYIRSNHNHILSIRFSTQGYITGVPHPFHSHRVLNYNLDTQETLQLGDLFLPDADYLQMLSLFSNNALSRRIQNKEMISAGTAPKSENYQNWNIKPNGLLITFDEGSVAPLVNGTQTVLIPYSFLKKILSPLSPIAGCIKHKRNCANQNLLTGGFIDEAINTRHGVLNPRLRLI